MTYLPGQFAQFNVLKANRWLKDVLDRHGIRRVIIGSVDLGWEKRRGKRYLQVHWHLAMWTNDPAGLEAKLKAIFLRASPMCAAGSCFRFWRAHQCDQRKLATRR